MLLCLVLCCTGVLKEPAVSGKGKAQRYAQSITLSFVFIDYKIVVLLVLPRIFFISEQVETIQGCS